MPAPPPPPLSPGPPPPVPTAVTDKAGALRAAFAGTPGRLRVAAVAVVVGGLLFGIGSYGALVLRSSAIADARNHAAQLVRLQAIRSSLSQADAAATNAFLVGGLEPADQRASYDDGIARATASIAAASSGSSSDAPKLAEINQVLARYAGLIESARANNRQGFPVGAAYLRQAGNLLRTDALPQLLELVSAEENHITRAYDDIGSANAAFVVTLGLALLALVAVQVWLSIKTRRTVNLNLAMATAIVVVGGLLGATAMTFAQNKATDVRSQSLSDTILLATSRSDAFNAKNNESLTLINRGNGLAFEVKYHSAMEHAVAQVEGIGSDRSSEPSAELVRLLDNYDLAHQEVRRLDDAGDWDAAVSLATSNDAKGTKVAFAAFDARSNVVLNQSAATVSDDLKTARRSLGWIAVLLLLAGFAAAVLAWRGIAERLREYR